ncbi:MAG: TolC family protein, partial [Nitrospinota bacterium]|nr:TolC family protein [Nitrospinota bacterium]
DTLKLILNITDDVPSWRLVISPTEKAAFFPIRLDEMQMTLDALRRRADIERARIEVDKQELLFRRARQNLLPKLDLSASASSNPTRNNLTHALDRLSSNKSYSLSGALNFRIPLGNRQAKSDLERARLQTLQSLASFNQLEQSIIEEVRRAIRRNRTDRKRIDASRISRRLAEERLAAQEKKFRVGLSTSRDILEDQESLANALTNETQALVDYNKSLATLGRVSYSSFERLRIRLEDPRNRAPEPKP